MEGLFVKFTTLKHMFSHEDEPWDYSEEPHCSRRREILAKHPEIKQLMGYDHSITYIVITEVILQVKRDFPSLVHSCAFVLARK